MDSSTNSEFAVAWALANLLKPSDFVVLMNCRPAEKKNLVITPANVAAKNDADAVAMSEALLLRYVQIFNAKKIACKGFALCGDKKTEIVNKVKEMNASTLVLGSRNMTGIARALTPSTSDYCVRNCSCPVVVAKPSDEELATFEPPLNEHHHAAEAYGDHTAGRGMPLQV